MSDAGQIAIREPDSEGCRLVIGSYSDVAPKVASAAAEAAERIMMSPVLGDFFELGVVDIGPRSTQAGKPTAVSRIAHELTRPSSGAERTYFALVIADKSAAAVEQVVEECRTSQIIAALPIRYCGVASIDDRRPSAEPAGGSGRVTNVMIPTAGSWSHGDLVNVLRRYAEELLHDFASAQMPGLTGEQLDLLRLDLLRPGNEEAPIAEESCSAGTDPALEPQSASPDILIPQKEPSPGTSVRPGSRRRPAPRRRRRRTAEPVADDSAIGTQGESRTAGLLFLILTGDESSDDRGFWRRGRSVLLEVDKKIGTAPGIAYQVRALQSNENATKNELRQPGQLSRHDIKGWAADLEFAQVLGMVQEVMKRDLAVLKLSAMRVTRPAIVFFAADAPLAEPIAADEYNKLAQEASITWVVPEHLAELISPVFAGGDARIIIDHEAVADEVFNLLCGSKTRASG